MGGREFILIFAVQSWKRKSMTITTFGILAVQGPDLYSSQMRSQLRGDTPQVERKGGFFWPFAIRVTPIVSRA